MAALLFAAKSKRYIAFGGVGLGSVIFNSLAYW